MADEAAAQRACKDPNPIIDGRKANVNLAYLGAKPRLPVGDILCMCWRLAVYSSFIAVFITSYLCWNSAQFNALRIIPGSLQTTT